MLLEFMQDCVPELSPEQMSTMAGDLDMSVVSSHYATEIRRPLVNTVAGDLIRMMLIQVCVCV